MPPDLLAELAQIEGISAVKQANAAELQPIDGLEIYAGDDATFARTLDMGGAGGILVASHIVGNEMQRMVQEPKRRAEINSSLADVYETLFITSNPTCTKAALNLLGHDVGGLRLPLVSATEEELTRIRAMSRARASDYWTCGNSPARERRGGRTVCSGVRRVS